MKKPKVFLVDVGLRDLPLPMTVPSRASADGQRVAAVLSVSARVMREYEAEWFDRFMAVTQTRRASLEACDFAVCLMDYASSLRAASVRLVASFPFFVEKRAPKSGLVFPVRYECRYTVSYPSVNNAARVILGVDCPLLSCAGGRSLQGRTTIRIEAQPVGALCPEDLVALADGAGLAPVYAHLSAEDRAFLEETARGRTSLDAVDALRRELAGRDDVGWYAVEAVDRNLFGASSTSFGLEKSRWVPGSSREYDED